LADNTCDSVWFLLLLLLAYLKQFRKRFFRFFLKKRLLLTLRKTFRFHKQSHLGAEPWKWCVRKGRSLREAACCCTPYCSICASLAYPSSCTRPYVSYSSCSRLLMNASTKDCPWLLAPCLLRPPGPSRVECMSGSCSGSRRIMLLFCRFLFL
jgi:hypothetical protein